MATHTPKYTATLLITPSQLLDNDTVLGFLLVDRSGPVVKTSAEEISNSSVRLYGSMVPEPLKKILLQFQVSAIKEKRAAIKKEFQAQRSGQVFETYYNNSMSRFLHGLFENIKPFSDSLPWHQTVPAGKGRFRTAPCGFSSYKPRLEFETIKINDHILLQTLVVLKAGTHPLESFRRYHFLLETGNVYHLLSYKDYQTLEWLANSGIAQNAPKPQELSSQILPKLETDYKVNRNNLFPKTEINVLPVNRIALSEISNSFLVLTPQWDYDGILVEGPWKPEYEKNVQGEIYLVNRNREQESAFRQTVISWGEYLKCCSRSMPTS